MYKVRLVGYLFGQGGIQTHTHWLATGLAERGHVVQVVSPSAVREREESLPSVRNYELQLYKSGASLGSIWSSLSNLAAGQFDAAVVCGTGWSAMLGSLLNRKIKRRVFFEVMSGQRSGQFDPRCLAKWGGFDAVVSQAKPVEAQFRESFRWSGVSFTIPALPDPLERSAAIPIRQTHLPPGRRLKAAYFGRLAEHKRVGWLCDEWKALLPFLESLDIWGTGSAHADISERIARNQLGGIITLRGRYPSGAEYITLMQQYDVVLLPTTGREGAPLVLLEAMACGVPFVANGVGGIPDYINPDCRITNGQLEAFVPSLASLYEQIQASQCNAERLQKHYIKHFSFNALIDRWEQFLQHLIVSS